MRRRFLALLLELAFVAACAPADAIEPPGASRATATSTPTSPGASSAPTIASSPEPSAPTASESFGEILATDDVRIGPPAPSPEPSRQPADERSAKPLALNLAHMTDFVPQYTSYWCVGASLQMARSIITGEGSEARRSQRRLWQIARDRSPSPYGGANPIGWTAALNDLGLGPYRLVSRPTFDAAVMTAARALADTRRPVGLVMWAGRHAWLMTGFESTGDPRLDDARVTRVRVMDPLYPHTSRWGRSPAPNRLVSLEKLARQYVMRDRPDYDFGVESGWLLVLPIG
jgi:hypothetical protein